MAATDLVGPGGARIPAADCHLFVQERPAPAYTKAAYWLLPLGDSLSLAANENYTFWLTLRSAAGTPPGTYRGAIEFRDAATPGQVLFRLPLVAEVWDVPTPSSDLLHFELEHIWFTMPGGYWIEKDRSRKLALTLDGQKVVETPVNDQAVLVNYIRALGDLEVDFAQNWSDVDRLYTLAFIRLREDGKLLSEELDQHPERFRGERLPSLDFSHGYDALWDAAIAAGMRCAAMNYQLAGDGSLGLAHRIARDNKLTAESELARRVRTWYWSEYVKYLRERGLLGVYTKIHDEFGPAGVADFVTSAKAIRAAGIRTYTTTYNFDRDDKAIAAIDPHLDLWNVAWPRQSPFELYRELKIPFEANNEVWGTTASSFWGNGEGLRAAGWMAARLGYGGVHTHGYMRWHWNDHEGCMVGPDRPYNSVAVTNGAEGMMEGRYLAQLRRLIAYAKRSGQAAELAAAIDREWQTSVIGVAGMEAAPNCLLPLRHQPGITGIDATWWPEISVSPATFAAAKRKVLEMTVRLQRAIGGVPRHVRYGDFDVVRDGNSACTLVADAAAAKRVQEAIRELAKPAGGATAGPQVVIGTLADDSVQRTVARAAPGEFTQHYPRPGHYAIRQLAATGGQPATLLIVGGDAAGVQSGLSHWMRLLTSDW